MASTRLSAVLLFLFIIKLSQILVRWLLAWPDGLFGDKSLYLIGKKLGN